MRLRKLDGTFELSHMDEVVDKMLHSDLLFDIALPRIPHRSRQHSISVYPDAKGCVQRFVFQACCPVDGSSLWSAVDVPCFRAQFFS